MSRRNWWATRNPDPACPSFLHTQSPWCSLSWDRLRGLGCLWSIHLHVRSTVGCVLFLTLGFCFYYMALIYPSFHFHLFLEHNNISHSQVSDSFLLGSAEVHPWSSSMFFTFTISGQMMRNRRDLASSSPAHYQRGSAGQGVNHPFLSPLCNSFVFVTIIFVPFSFFIQLHNFDDIIFTNSPGFVFKVDFSVQPVEIH